MGSPYPGGCTRILMLMHLLGEPTFWKSIHTFLDTYKFQPATTDNFFDSMSKSSGVDLTGYKKQWYHTAATPSLTASVFEGNLVIDQLQPYYTLDLPVWVLDGSKWVKKSIHVEGAESKLPLGNLAGKPLLVDPEVWTPMELGYAMPLTEHDVYELYTHAPNVAQKARIISELFDSISVSQRIAIGHGETYFGLLQMIADRVGKDGESYLLELSRNPDPRVVNSAVIALGRIKPGDSATARLKEILNRNSNELIREHAMQSLLNASTDPVLALNAWNRNSFDDGFRVMAVNWWGEHQPEVARKKCLEILKNPISEPVRVTAIRVLGRVKEGPTGNDVYRALVKVAQETSFGAKTSAIQALALIGNKAAIDILKPIAAKAHGGVRGNALSAIEKLSKLE